MINTRSIQFRLILWYGSLVTFVSLAFGAYIYRAVEVGLYNDLARTLERRANQIATDILPRSDDTPPEAIANQVRMVYAPETTDRFIRILRSDLSTFYVSDRPGGGSFDPNLVVMPKVGESRPRIEPVPGHAAMLIVTVPAKVGGDNFLIQMGQSTADITAVLHRLVHTLLAGLSLVVVVVSTGGYVLVRRSLRPVEQLRATAEKLTIGTVTQRLPVAETGDAIEHLGTTLNRMLDRLDAAYQQASRFSADASHELRTPLTVIRAELESIVRRDCSVPEPIRARVGSVLEETERLSAITESLFRLSRLDAGEAKMRDEAVELAHLVRSTVDQLQLLAEEKHIALGLRTEQDAAVRGDPDRLKQVVIDLLDNAIKYTPDSGRIAIRVFAAGDKAVLEIADTGIGIPADALPHVFERFYRTEGVRSRQLPGAGLGLAIVRSIVQAHGGAVDIASIEAKGTTVRVELPLAG